MNQELKLALVQMCSTNTHAGNIEVVTEHIAAAAARGMDLVCFPEVAGLMNSDRRLAAAQIVAQADDPYLAACREAAAAHHIWVHTGSTPMRSSEDSRFVNRAHLLAPDGAIAASYDKIHLFDVDLPDGKRIRESDRYAPGARAVVAATPWGPWGMSICYDLRFPHLYRDYGHAGVNLMFVPSAFAENTGLAHWEVLLRARAIENGCFVIASAQSGVHADGRRTYGHAMAVDPWGAVMVDMHDTIGVHDLSLDLSKVARTRQMIPSLANDRNYEAAPSMALEGAA
jgi:deaminated glutathione amidase